MNLVKRKYLQILRIELEHLEQHIDQLISEHVASGQARTETEHVCLENVAVLQNEECGLHAFMRVLDNLDVDEYADIDALHAGIEEKFVQRVRECGFAEVALIYARKKMVKVRDYCRPTGVTAKVVRNMEKRVRDGSSANSG